MKRMMKLFWTALTLVAAAASAKGGCVVRDSVLVIGPEVTEVAAHAYVDNDAIAVLDASRATQLETIGEYAFMGCRNLKNVKLPSSLKKIGEGAFRECGALEEINIPATVEALPRALFAWCTKLRRVVLHPGLKDIGSQAFAYCGALEGIEIPESVEHIGSNVFSKCGKLEHVVLPSNLKELESYVFSDCTGLKYVRLPANGNLLGELIFTGCTGLGVIDAPSPEVPKFDCESFLFDPDDESAYARCLLRVPEVSLTKYRRSHCWDMFEHIEPIYPTEY